MVDIPPSIRERAIKAADRMAADWHFNSKIINRRLDLIQKKKTWRVLFVILQITNVLNIVMQLGFAWLGIATFLGVSSIIGNMFGLMIIYINGLARKPSQKDIARGLAGDLIEMQAIIVMDRFYAGVHTGEMDLANHKDNVESIVELANTVGSFRMENSGTTVIKDSVIPVVDHYGREYVFKPEDVEKLISAMNASPQFLDVYQTILDLIKISHDEDEGKVVRNVRVKISRGRKK